MVQVTVKMYNLQELIRKVYLEGLINSAVILFKDNRMKIEAMGVEDEQSVIDQTLTVDVNYPCDTMTEGGEIALEKIGDFLSNLEIFERDDVVQLSVANNQFVVTRMTPPQVLTFDLADKKFIKTYSEGLKTVFGSPIKLIRLDGKEKVIAFDASVTVDAQKLKEHGKKVSEIAAKSIPIIIKDGKFITTVRGEVSGLTREVEGVTAITGNASTICRTEFLKIIKRGIGVAILRFSEGSPLHIHFEHESMTADYLLQIYEEK
jgi:hypothetical protein